ncbi:MAG: glycosyltransferase family 4 protein [Gemmataceae bacterium]|jgi:glycosyltransferase involved in cell wall biosynthesis
MLATTSLKITLVTETFPPEINGVALTLEKLHNFLNISGHRPSVIRPRRFSETRKPELVQGFPIPMYPKLRFGIGSPLRLYQTIKSKMPDIIHLATEGPLGLACLGIAKSLRIPVVSSFHTNFDLYANDYKMGFLSSGISHYLRWFHNQTEATFAPSNACLERLQALGYKNTKIWTRGVDTSLFNPIQKDLNFKSKIGLSETDILLLYVGRLAPEKNIGSLLETFKKARSTLNKQGKNLFLALVGTGPLVGQSDLEKTNGIILPGELRGNHLAQWYASADIFVFPSTSETFGNVILEAQASGLPVLCLNSQATQERICNHHDGILAANIEEFERLLTDLTADKSKRDYLGKNAFITAKSQKWDDIFNRLYQEYCEVIESTKTNFPNKAA